MHGFIHIQELSGAPPASPGPRAWSLPLRSLGGLPGGPNALAAALAVVLASAMLGALAAVRPEWAAVLIALACMVAACALLARWVRSWYVLPVFCLLAGYMALNRGFAGINISVGQTPLYIGELALAMLLPPAIWLARGKRLGVPFVALGAWMAFNAVLTLQNVPEYGLVAIRDAATWYYGLFALVGVAIWYGLGEAGIRSFYAILFLLAYAGGVVGLLTSAQLLPPVQLPVSDVASLTQVREDATSVQIIGALVFFLIMQRASSSWVLRPPLTWLYIAVSVALVAATLSRGPVVALVGSLALLIGFGLWRRVAAMVVAMSVIVLTLVLADLQIETSRGVVSAASVVDRQLSTVAYLTNGSAGDADPTAIGTISWRAVWWQGLIDEALADPRILVLGRGYGPDLRDVVAGMEGIDGTSYQQGEDVGRPLRSPHNIAITILSRSGLVGLALWLLMLAAAFWVICQRVLAAKRDGDRERERFGVWLLVYLFATVVVACFGVLLEGPFAAIPFFCTLGVAIAWAAERRHQEHHQAAAA